LITIHQEVIGYLVLLDTLITIHQEVIGYLVLLDTLITIHQAVSITAGSQEVSLTRRSLVQSFFNMAATTVKWTINQTLLIVRCYRSDQRNHYKCYQ
jgi:hypothetical protein